MRPEERSAFLKGHLRQNSRNPYQDPTFLTFTLMFDMTSPLFNPEVAQLSLTEQYGEPKRAAQLKKFVDTILLINKEMPWYWKSITGIERVHDINTKNPYWGGDDAKLTIECNESINLAITGLMDIYRDAMFNLKGWTEVLPENYRKFNMYVTVSEVRAIQTTKTTSGGLDQVINEDITGDFKPYFMFKFGQCEFDLSSAKETFESLSSSEPANPGPKINIKYETIDKISAQYLNGISTAEIVDGPGPGTETPEPTFAQRAANALNDAAATAMGGITNFNPIKDFTRPGNVYGSVLDQAFERQVSNLDAFAGGVGNIPENLFKDGLSATGNVAQGLLKSAKQNIFGIEAGSTLGAALRQGSINSILPQINNIGGGKQDLGNVNK